MNKLKHQTKNTDTLATLLKQFFEYYSEFDFASKAICLNEAVAITKPEHSPLYIVNPLERGLNVSKNVSVEELERFVVEVRNAVWTLEMNENRDTNWGLLSLFENSQKRRVITGFGLQQSGRLMDVSKLFEDDNEEESTGEIVYKNEAVKKQVQNIRQETEDALKVIKNRNVKTSHSNIKEKHQR